ncbi:hypothetical protein [Flagellimonas marina]|jgi:hypothetical protein|uniref:Alginate lyase domain-containing protein n=1 Tax=Flagellimonas marina TaxID=1775168 RepID=A0ABV8PKJ5_9FLAO
MDSSTFNRTFLMIIPLCILFFISCTKDNDLFLESVLEEEQEEIQNVEQEENEENTDTPQGNTNGLYYQVMFTDRQVDEMVSRVANGFSKPGTNGEDIIRMINEAEDFLADPGTGRLDWMPSSNIRECRLGCDPVPTNIFNREHYVSENIFYAGFYAFLLANRNEEGDLTYANQLSRAIATQTLKRANDPNLNFDNRSSWLDGTETNPFFLTAAWLEKTLNNWSLIKSMNLDTGLTNEEEEIIEDWFKSGRDWLYDKLTNHYIYGFGSSWKSSASDTGYNMKYSGSNNAVIAINGIEQTDYTVNHAAVLPHWNVPSKYASFLHYYGLIFQDQSALDLSETWYQNVFKLSVFPDGTTTELKRATSSNSDLGLVYWGITMSTLSSIAHSHAVAVLQNNPIVQGYSYSYFYDYTTSEGLSDYLPTYKGSDTKGGVKGLETYLLAFTKFLGQSTGLNAWGEVRQVNVSGYPTHQMPNKFHYMVPLAQANAYYNNTTLQNAYSGTGGFQRPLTKAEGALGIGAWSEAYMGGFGKFLIAFPYLEMEGLSY